MSVQEANKSVFDHLMSNGYYEGAPHLLHPEIVAAQRELIERAIKTIKSDHFCVLDLGAGDGSVTLYWLMKGAHVTAVDLSAQMLAQLELKCTDYVDRLECIATVAEEYLSQCKKRYDVISCFSFLHHIPDYLTLVNRALLLLKTPGVFLTFADPLRYNTLRRRERALGTFAYAFWRIGRPDLLGGIRRRLRRARGVYLKDSIYDNTEYHVTRNGVDQEAIVDVLRANQMVVDSIRYWATQSRMFQRLGKWLNLVSDFGIFALKE